jgi:predicted phage-related endonuclease
MKKLQTITYTVDITEIIKGGVDTKFLLTEYPDIIKEKLKNKMEFDDVHVKNIKVLEHE